MATASKALYVLHQRPHRENSTLLTVLDEQNAIYQGIRYGKKSCQPFVQYAMQVNPRKKLAEFKQCEAGHSISFGGIKLYCGLYINELMVKFQQGITQSSGLYEIYHQVLTQLSETQDIDSVLRYFEWALFRLLGYQIDFDYDRQGGVLEPNKFYYYVPESGFQSHVVRQGRGFDGKTLLQLAAQIKQNIPLAVECAGCAKVINRQMIHWLLDGQELHSRKLFLERG